jgi:hypothetical protein
MKNIKKIAAAAAIMLMAFTTSASAELITNGDFETGTLNGWSNTSNFVNTAFDGYQPFGRYALYFGCVGVLCSTSQTIATTQGANYIFSFEYGSDGGTPNEFIANFGNTEVFHRLNDLTSTRPGFIHESFNVVATGSSTLVNFSGRNDPSYQALDNVSVISGNFAEPRAVPEPATIALLGLGLISLAFTRRKLVKNNLI